MQFLSSAEPLHGRAALPAWGFGFIQASIKKIKKKIKKKQREALGEQDKGGKKVTRREKGGDGRNGEEGGEREGGDAL